MITAENPFKFHLPTPSPHNFISQLCSETVDWRARQSHLNQCEDFMSHEHIPLFCLTRPRLYQKSILAKKESIWEHSSTIATSDEYLNEKEHEISISFKSFIFTTKATSLWCFHLKLQIAFSKPDNKTTKSNFVFSRRPPNNYLGLFWQPQSKKTFLEYCL